MTQPVEFLYVVPVGAVIAWCPTDPSAAPPPGFAYCNGQTITDPDSPYVGKVVPNLINQLVLGTVPQGVGLGAAHGTAAANINGPLNTNNIVTSPTNAAAQDITNNGIIQGNSVPPPVWRYVLSEDTSIKDGNHHHVIGPGGIQVAPPGSIALYYIIRIK